jgi:hypothetical protein
MKHDMLIKKGYIAMPTSDLLTLQRFARELDFITRLKNIFKYINMGISVDI